MRRRLLVVGAFVAILGWLVSAAAPAPPPLRLPDDIVAEAQEASGADVTYTVRAGDDAAGNPLSITCNFPSGSQAAGTLRVTARFPIGTTTVGCSATDGAGTTVASGSFNVTVRDTTPPVVSVPGSQTVQTEDPAGATVSFAAATATDSVDGALTPTCDHSSGSLFPVGTTTVTCRATDSHGNTGTASFGVTVVILDTTPPVVTVPGDQSLQTENPAGANVSFSVSATDGLDGSLTPACDHASGSLFPVGTTTVTCTATDSHGNTGSANFAVTIVLVDTTAPVVTVPGDMTVETEDPAGANVSFTVSATDNVDGALTPSCNHVSGSFFAVGSSAVTCTATDSHGNTGSAGFTATVVFVDRTPPNFSGVPAGIVTEANGPAGSVVLYTPPIAVDAVDGPIADVTCAPGSAATFALGTTTVTCSATDSHGNVGKATFKVTVQDTTPPILRIPGDIAVDATTSAGIPASEPALARYLGSASATDSVDPNPLITSNAPAFFPVGTTRIEFRATDGAGNTATAAMALTVRPQPAPGTPPAPAPPPPDRTPPDEVTGLTATAGSGFVRLSWTRPTAADFDHVAIFRSEATGESGTKVVYEGAAKVFVDRTVRNGTSYRYLVVTYDRAGNRSSGIAVVALPKAQLLVAPADGAKVSSPPVLAWVDVRGATYYNVQLFRIGGKALNGRMLSGKVLSAWPTKNRLALHRTWRYAGRSYRLSRGLYRWYVWPGVGPPKAAKYGDLLGESTFEMTR